MHTERVEYHQAAHTGIAGDGHFECSNQAELNERSWLGPWLGQPQSIHP
jgi:hypothetical protein